MTLDELCRLVASDNFPLRLHFKLVRYGEAQGYAWDAGTHGCVFLDEFGEVFVSLGTPIEAIDGFVTRVESEAGVGTEASEKEGFEVPRFDRSSVTIEPYTGDELDACGLIDDETPDAAAQDALKTGFVEVMNETFNAPSLYDARDLRTA